MEKILSKYKDDACIGCAVLSAEDRHVGVGYSSNKK